MNNREKQTGSERNIDAALVSFEEAIVPLPNEETAEIAEFNRRRRDFVSEHISEQIVDLRHYRDLRKKFSFRVFCFMCVWSGLVFATIILQGFCWIRLGNPVLVTLAGGTTISVVGLVGFIVRGLFNTPKSEW